MPNSRLPSVRQVSFGRETRTPGSYEVRPCCREPPDSPETKGVVDCQEDLAQDVLCFVSSVHRVQEVVRRFVPGGSCAGTRGSLQKERRNGTQDHFEHRVSVGYDFTYDFTSYFDFRFLSRGSLRL